MVKTRPPITKQVFDGFIHCRRKGILRLTSSSSNPTDYVRFLDARRTEYSKDAKQHLRAKHPVTHSCSSETSPQKHGSSLLLDVPISCNRYTTTIDALERYEGSSDLGSFHYRPVRFVPGTKPDRRDKLLLAFDCLALGSFQGVIPPKGRLIYGTLFRTMQTSLDKYTDALSILMCQVDSLSATELKDSPHLNTHCNICEFQHDCYRKAVDVDHLSLLRGITEKEVSRHNDKGIFTVHQLSYTFRSRRPAKRTKPKPKPVWSKYSCGFPMVIFQQPTQAFFTAD
jgi:predicted RecB family nuclease